MDFVKFEKIDNIGIVTIDREKALNALNSQVLCEILELFSSKIPEDIYCVLVKGAGDKAFVAGADIAEMKDKSPKEAKDFGNLGNKAFKAIENFKYPVIALINGFALGGGCELALACDIRICTDKSKFGQPEVSLGITPGYGGTQRLPRLVGVSKAKEIIYTGRILKAEEALNIGLVNKVCLKDELLDEGLKMAKSIANNAPVAVSLCKEIINDGLDVDLDTALNLESLAFASCFATQDQKMAMNAFVNKQEKTQFENK